MVNRNFKQRMRQTLYRLKRDYGSGPVAIYTLTSSTTNVQTGSTIVDKEVTILPRVIVLPVTLSREVIQSISHISANKMFSYGGALDARTRMFIIDQEDTPGLNLQKDSWIVFRNKKYSIKSINDYDFRSGWVVVAQEQVGVAPEQSYLRWADHLLAMEVECATHLAMPVQTALSVLKVYDEAVNDAAYRVTSVISLTQLAQSELVGNAGAASTTIELLSEAVAYPVWDGMAFSSLELTSQASTLAVFSRATEVTVTLGDESIGFLGLDLIAENDLVLDSTANATMAFPAAATDTLVVDCQASAYREYSAEATDTLEVQSVASARYTSTQIVVDTLVLDVVIVNSKEVTQSILTELVATTTAVPGHVTTRSASDTISATQSAAAEVVGTEFPSGWSFRMPITIEADYIDADLSNWTYVFDQRQDADLTAANGPLASSGTRPMLNGGGDIRFTTDSAGTNRLAIDVRRCITSATEANRLLEIAVKIPAVSASVDTTIYMWWGKADVTQPGVDEDYGQYDAYDDNYDVVLPLSEAGDGTSGEYRDRTRNQEHATGKGGIPQQDTSTTARMGFCQAFANTDYIEISYASPKTFTWEVPFYINSSSEQYDVLIGVPYTTNQIVALDSSRNLSVWNETQNGANFGVGNLALTTWHNIAFTRAGDSTTNGYKVYFNGGYTGQGNTGVWSNANAVCIGGRGDASQYYFGRIDEVRISDVVRSAAWIKADHTNFLQPANLSVFGSITDL